MYFYQGPSRNVIFSLAVLCMCVCVCVCMCLLQCVGGSRVRGTAAGPRQGISLKCSWLASIVIPCVPLIAHYMCIDRRRYDVMVLSVGNFVSWVGLMVTLGRKHSNIINGWQTFCLNTQNMLTWARDFAQGIRRIGRHPYTYTYKSELLRGLRYVHPGSAMCTSGVCDVYIRGLRCVRLAMVITHTNTLRFTFVGARLARAFTRTKHLGHNLCAVENY